MAGCGSSSPSSRSAPTTRTGPPSRPVPSTAPGGAAANGIRSDARGLALAARIARAYASAPAVIATGEAGRLPIRFVSILTRGTVVAEEFLGMGPTGNTYLVASRGSPTFARPPGASCWRPLASSSPQRLTDVGKRFPPLFATGSRIGAPRRTSGAEALTLTGNGASVTVTVDARTLRIRTITIVAKNERATEHVRALTSKPTLISAQPHC